MKAFDYRNRTALRKEVEGIQVAELRINGYESFAHKGTIIDISSTGLLIKLHRDDITEKEYKRKFQLNEIVGEQLYLEIDLMELDIDGVVTRTRATGGGYFEIAVDYSAGSPEYWRECLVDLLPNPNEEEFDPDIDDEDDWHYEES